jgi:hypothetical protein
VDKNGSFMIEKPFGVIGPNSSVPLQFKICPVEPMNYYRRVYCLVEDQDAIVFVD